MSQVDQPDNLNRWDNLAFRPVTSILIRCRLRVSDALRFPQDCVLSDAAGAPYLRYLNFKMKREALVPIDEELHGLIGAQQARVDNAPLLFPRPTKNPEQRFPSNATYRAALYRWLDRCDVRDEHGRLVRLTRHQWRHTLGARGARPESAETGPVALAAAVWSPASLRRVPPAVTPRLSPLST